MSKLELSLIDYADYTNVNDISNALLKDIRKQSSNNQVPIPVPIHDIAMSLDIASIDPIPPEVKSFEGILYKQGWQGFIFYNNNSPETRQRFTIGHELGHWVIPSHLTGNKLSCTKQQTSSFTTTGKNIPKEVRIEIEANYFSAQILMPSLEFRKEINRVEPDLRHLFRISQKYNVSMAACCVRFKELSDFSCVIIHHHNFVITRVLKTKKFPSLDRNFKTGSFISPKSISVKVTVNTSLEPADWRLWLQNKNSDNTELYEQVFQQNDGYRITLLYLDDSKVLDEDDLEIERLSEWNPKFKR